MPGSGAGVEAAGVRLRRARARSRSRSRVVAVAANLNGHQTKRDTERKAEERGAMHDMRAGGDAAMMPQG